MSDIVRKQQLMQLVPILPTLGVPPDKIRAELVRLFDLPKEWAEAAPQEQEQEQPAMGQVPLDQGAVETKAMTSSVIGGA
jgi:hypothetical protein